MKDETMLLIEESRTPSEAKDVAAQAQTNTALELTPVVAQGFSFSCHAGCLRSRKMNRASRFRTNEQSLARMQLNFIR
jgi:hypothetical protein